MSSVAQRVLTGAALVAAVAVLLALDGAVGRGVVPWVAGVALAGLALAELVRMRARGASAALFAPALALVAVLTWPWREPEVRDPRAGLALSAALVWVGILLGTLRERAALREPGRLLRAGLLATWIVPALVGLALVDRAWGLRGLAVLVALSKVGDVFGYLVGRAIGRTHPFPRVSPGKTTAGCVASLVAAVVAGGALGAAGLLPGPGPAEGGAGAGLAVGCAAGLVINLAAQGGDLLESVVKRRAGVKDSSTWVGAAGGVLDVVDSLLLSVPLACLVWPWLFGNG